MAQFSRRTVLQAMRQNKRSIRSLVEGLEERCLMSVSLKPHVGAPAVKPFAGIEVKSFKQEGLCVKGTVVSTDTLANTITVSSTDKTGATTQTTYTLAAGATITADGKAVTLADLTAGVKVAVKSTVADPTIATAVKAIGAEVEGKVTAVDTTAGTITLADKTGATTTYTLGTAPITQKGVAITLADVAVGSFAELKFSALSPTTLLKVEVSPPRPAETRCVQGTVTAVDTTAGTVTVSVLGKGGVATDTTFTLAPGATLIADGKAITLADLTAGLKVAIKFSSDAPTVATSITAIGNHVEGKVTAVDTTAGTITLTDRKGVSTTYTVGTATITRKGVAIALADITLGSFAELKFSALSPTTLLSVKICGK